MVTPELSGLMLRIQVLDVDRVLRVFELSLIRVSNHVELGLPEG